MEVLEIFLHSFINLAILLFEYIGVGIITFSGIQGIVNYIRRNPETRLILAKGLAMGLEFKLGSEILRTVIVNSFQEICIVAGIIALRATLTVLIHWEIKNEQHEKLAEAAETMKTAETAKTAEATETAQTEKGDTADAAKTAQAEKNNTADGGAD